MAGLAEWGYLLLRIFVRLKSYLLGLSLVPFSELSEPMMGFVKSTRRYKLKVLPVVDLTADEQINHRLHFILTLLSFGLWGLVWWWLILKAKGKSDFIFSGFDDDYWSYLIEREQPPAALYRQQIAPNKVTEYFDA